jgi:protein transport protein SEC31
MVMDLSLRLRTLNWLVSMEMSEQGKINTFRLGVPGQCTSMRSFHSCSNPYHSTERPGHAKGPGGTLEKAPVSTTLDMNNISEVQPEHSPIRDCLPSLIEALKGTTLSTVDKRLLAESEKAVAVLLKRLNRGDISADVGTKMVQMCGLITSYDFKSAQSIQTALVHSDWRDNKDWLKGIKAMLQLATKKFAQ